MEVGQEAHSWDAMLRSSTSALLKVALPEPSCDANVMHAPCSKAFTAAQASFCSHVVHPRQDQAKPNEPKGKQSYEAQHSCHSNTCLSIAAQLLLCLQTHLMNRTAPTSASWLHTCSKSKTMRPRPTWAGSNQA